VGSNPSEDRIFSLRQDVHMIRGGTGGRGAGVRVMTRARFSFLCVVHTGYWVYLASFPISTGGSFPGSKVAVA
jgi:hypothetical protein